MAQCKLVLPHMSSTNNSIPTVHRTIVYLDGYNLYHGLMDRYDRKYLWLDLTRFALSLLSDPRQQLISTKYFTSEAPGGSTSDSWQRQQTYWKALKSCPMLEVVKGSYREKAVRCKSCRLAEAECKACGQKLVFRNEKRTDVNIATHLVRDACEGNFEVAILVSGDTDLVPAVEVVKEKKCRIVVGFPPDRATNDMKDAAGGAAFKITEGQLKRSQFPRRVEIAPGIWVERPTKWW